MKAFFYWGGAFLFLIISMFSVVFALEYDSSGQNYQNGTKTIQVSDLTSLKSALSKAEPGDRILITQGIYDGGFRLGDIQGTKKRPIVIAGNDPEYPPVFQGRGEAVKMSRVGYVKIENIRIEKRSGNGINIDDGGDSEHPSHHIILENLQISEIGKKGNIDAIKMSGVDHFVIRNCKIQGWGGSAIDFVGCHQGVVQGCTFEDMPGYRTKNAIQIKGGSQRVLIENNAFINCGERTVNIGGSTGTPFFRPQNADCEADNIIVAGNNFVGGEAQISWVTSQNSHVHHNIFYLPEKWVGRILQETKDSRFILCRKGFFEANMVVTDERVQTFFNIGPNTQPEMFSFSGNAWYRFESDEKPDLPTLEVGGIYDVYPDLIDFGTAKMRIGSRSDKLKNIGPKAYTPWDHGTDFEDIHIPEVKWVEPARKSGRIPMQTAIIVGLLGFSFLVVIIRRAKK
ncbi:right-handed parallel beta-helix repeat-containing protein [uncultured Desulfobacter sp.]|uniref:right-handed parallel beta-helix repeat-containing protein n=1 Tax=uncultured Desulfobacter sp. TaxID=240139 RepID=UPI002AAAFBAB|nr:right-handed parallel beta-helix repeat-containing protein [uncultured Desulfobacter sp.]